MSENGASPPSPEPQLSPYNNRQNHGGGRQTISIFGWVPGAFTQLGLLINPHLPMPSAEMHDPAHDCRSLATVPRNLHLKCRYAA